MAKGNSIIVSAHPRGRYLEGIVNGTPKPGTVMTIDVGVAAVAGRFTWEPAGSTASGGASQDMAADGNRQVIAILREDENQGFDVNKAYVDGTVCFLYFPMIGDELNMILENQAGTADDFVIGDKLIVDDGTGKLLISAGSVEAEPFMCLEAITDMTADTLTHVLFTGT